MLDEPGLNLHAKAQGDLLRYIEEELAENHQVIYSTHSPFMIDSNHWERIRTVQDKETGGTKVSNDPLETDSDTLFPLQAALGYDIAQTLFISTNNLLVEGPSDLIYLNVASRIQEENKDVSLDEKWAIIPVGGADKISTFVSLLGGSKLNIAAFIDIAAKDQQRIESLIKNKLLKKGNLFTAGEFIGKTEADVEDMFDEDEYLNVVSEAYKDELDGKPIKVSDLNPKIPRITKRIETYFKEKGISNGKFNHFRPADILLKKPKLEPKLFNKSALGNFKKLFEGVNGVLR